MSIQPSDYMLASGGTDSGGGALGAHPKIMLPENEYELMRLQFNIIKSLIYNLRQVIYEQGITFTGDLADSFIPYFNPYGAKTKSMMPGVLTNNPYAHLVDMGMSPGMWVDYDALYDWVRIKLGIEEPELTVATWNILKAIRKNGTKPTRFVKKAIKKLIKEHGYHKKRRKRKQKPQKVSSTKKPKSISSKSSMKHHSVEKYDPNTGWEDYGSDVKW